MSDYTRPTAVTKVLALDEIEPPYDQPEKCPKSLTKTRRIDNVLYVAGKPPAKHEHTDEVQSDIMFVATAVEEDEAQELTTTSYGVTIKQKADYLRGPAGNLFKEVCGRSGIFPEEHYFTALVKWLLPKTKRNSPPMGILKWGMPILLDEIARVKPKIIVCLGKKVFDLLSDVRMNFKDANGGWFWSTKANAHLYVMQSPYMLIPKPELHEMFRVDLTEISRKLDILKYGTINDLPVNIEVIDNWRDLRDWAARMKEEGHKLFSVDGEWHGRQHIDGHLRSLQFAWTDSDAIYIKFRNEQNQFCFDMEGAPAPGLKTWVDTPPTGLEDWAASLRLNPNLGKLWDMDQDPDYASITQAKRDEMKLYRQIGGVIGSVTNKDDVKFVGHHYVADAVWMDRWLGLKVIGKCHMDTEFAQQTADESSELKLERGISMKYTTLGRYDLDLVIWKKDNKALCEDGYGFIPDKIIIPYACLRGESKVQLGDGSWKTIRELVKSRYSGTVMALVDGQVKPCKVTGWKKSRKLGQTWFRLKTASSRYNNKGLTGPVFTPDHKILTQRGMVPVEELRLGEDRIVTDEKQFSSAQAAVILGSLLGDGGLTRRNSAMAGLQFSQHKDRGDYARWKAEVLSSALEFRESESRDQLCFESSYCRQLVALEKAFPRHTAEEHCRRKLVITKELLDCLGALGLAVWYQDDGVYTRDKTCRIICRKLSVEEQEVAVKWFNSRFPGRVHYDPIQGALMFDRYASFRFLTHISGFMHPAMGHKTYAPFPGMSLPQLVTDSGELFEEVIEDRVEAPRGKEAGHDTRYCLTVPEAGNFLTKVGFVSNCKDVLAVYRAVPFIQKNLEAQRLWDYYQEIHNPFVTDVFFTFTQTGLPMDLPLMDELRELFNWCRRELDAEFKVKVHQDAKERLVGKCVEILGLEVGLRAGIQTVNMISNGEAEKAWDEIKTVLPLDKFMAVKPFLDHLQSAPEFNIRAPDQMRRWLFEVSGMTPIKSTNNKGKGMPSMDWQKVLELPPEKQALYTPSVDKQTLMILDSQLPLVSDLLDLNVVGNLCKAFLKEPEEYYDEELDEMVVEEAGLHQWVCSDVTVRGQTSCTETSRPRGWAPNSLNFPSYVNKRIGKVVARIISSRLSNGIGPDPGQLPETLKQWSHVKDEKDLPSIRSVVKAISGWCLVESDYQTAEIRGMAYISGDTNLMRLMNDPDPEWAFTKDGYKVRVAYTDFKLSGIPTAKQNPAYLMKRMEGGKVIAEYTEADLIRNEQTGAIVHCRYDLHWSIAEWTYEMPREEMLDKVHRAAGKVLNFSSAYGASPSSLERKIESDTGVKPAEGTGQKGLDAIAARQPRATEFLEEMQDTPSQRGWYRAASGRLRHCVTHDRSSGVNYRTRNSIESATGRELRNFPMQESVASTAARAGKWLGATYRNAGLRARVITILYDSVVTMCPLEEREVVAHLHQQFMCDANNWVYDDAYGFRELTYPIDTEFNWRWSTKPSKADKVQLEDMTWHPTPDRLKWLLNFVAPKAAPVPLVA